MTGPALDVAGPTIRRWLIDGLLLAVAVAGSVALILAVGW